MKKLTYLTFLFLLSTMACGTNSESDPESEAASPELEETPLEGRWRSEDDEKSVIVISGNSFISIYDGSVISEDEVEYFETCPEDCAKDYQEACFMVRAQFDASCYAIVNLTATELTYSMLGGTGNTLSYSKIIE